MAGAVSATEKGGGKLEVLWVRFEAGRSPAMVYVGMSQSLGSKHGQYTLGTLYSPLANPQSYGSAKQIGLTDSARRALVALDFPCSEGGGELSSVQGM